MPHLAGDGWHAVGAPVHEHAQLGLVVPAGQRPRVQAGPVRGVASAEAACWVTRYGGGHAGLWSSSPARRSSRQPVCSRRPMVTAQPAIMLSTKQCIYECIVNISLGAGITNRGSLSVMLFTEQSSLRYQVVSCLSLGPDRGLIFEQGQESIYC